MNRLRGLTLPEILVAMTLLGLIGLVTLQIFLTTRTVLNFGSGRMDVQQTARETLRRLVPLVESAIPRNLAQGAVLLPADGASGSRLEFLSTQDHLGGTALDPRNPVYYRFAIFRQPDGDVFLEQTNPATTLPRRRLARGLRELFFENQGGTSVRIRVQAVGTVRNARGADRDVQSTLETLVFLPYYLHQPGSP
ncbi:MAG: type II secretion system protein [Candidatus Eremiobacterota bacterium]